MEQQKSNAPDIKPTSELVEKLVNMLAEANGKSNVMEESGACVYNTPNGPKCAVLTRSQCSGLGGNFVGGTCN